MRSPTRQAQTDHSYSQERRRTESHVMPRLYNPLAQYSAVSGFSPLYHFEPPRHGSVTIQTLESLLAVTTLDQCLKLKDTDRCHDTSTTSVQRDADVDREHDATDREVNFAF